MEYEVEIPTDDGHIIHGTLNSTGCNSKGIIIFVHGITGNQHEHQYYNAPAFFNPKGYDIFRFDQYSGEKKARKLRECCLTTHANDINTVLSHYKNNENIIVVGHSLGCVAMTKADLSPANKIVLWDPTNGMKDLAAKGGIKGANNKSYLDWALTFEISEEMVSEWKAFDEKEHNFLNDPKYYFIFAGAYDKFEHWAHSIDSKNSIIVPKATHRFVEEGTLLQAYEAMLTFIEK